MIASRYERTVGGIATAIIITGGIVLIIATVIANKG